MLLSRELIVNNLEAAVAAINGSKRDLVIDGGGGNKAILLRRRCAKGGILMNLQVMGLSSGYAWLRPDESVTKKGRSSRAEGSYVRISEDPLGVGLKPTKRKNVFRVKCTKK